MIYRVHLASVQWWSQGYDGLDK